MTTHLKLLRVKSYVFHDHDGTSRPVIAIYAGSRPMGFVEYGDAHRLVDIIRDLVDQYEVRENW